MIRATIIKGMGEVTTFVTLNTHKVSTKCTHREWASNKVMVYHKSAAQWVLPSPQSSHLGALLP